MDITIKSVAEAAGVSISTVSRVLNAPHTVTPETRERIVEVMERLQYRPNVVARSLSSKRTRTLGMIVPNLSDFFVSELYRGVNSAATSRGMKVIVFDADSNQSRVTTGLDFMKEHKVDGIVFASDFIPSAHNKVLASFNIPIALVLTESRSSPALTAFKVDDVQAVFDAVKFLVARGHRKIGMISGPKEDEIAGKLRLRGYEMAMEYHDLPFNEQFISYGNWRYAHGYAAMSEMLSNHGENHLTAIIAASDEMAVGAIRSAVDHGLRVPNDISIMGFDDLSLADMSIPKLTTVRQPFQKIGEEAVHFLLDVIEGKERERNGGIHYLPHKIIDRESVAIVSR